jgi:ketosteroid isomerase-like protein
MNRAIFVLAALFGLVNSGLASGKDELAPPPQEQIAGEVRAALFSQQAAWNKGDIDTFTKTYDANALFVSGDEITRGAATILERYKKKYSDRAKMGTLAFSDLEITALDENAALVLGRWSLKRANDEPHGRFTLLFRKTSDGWRIVHDHTSAAEK